VRWLGLFRFECELFGYNGVTAWQGYKSIYYRAINCSNILILAISILVFAGISISKIAISILKFQLIELIFNITIFLEAFSCIQQCNRYQYFFASKISSIWLFWYEMMTHRTSKLTELSKPFPFFLFARISRIFRLKIQASEISYQTLFWYAQTTICLNPVRYSLISDPYII